MQYYDYRQYFQTIISNQELIISSNKQFSTFLSAFFFIFTCFFMYYLIRNMIKNR